jgi:DNA-binding transcriptional ArsR family regulator
LSGEFGVVLGYYSCILNLMVQYLQGLDGTFSALSDPTRRAILERLGRGPATIGELAEPAGMSLTGLGKHVRVLEEAGLVTTEKVGRRRECRLGPGRLEDATRWIERYRRLWERRLDGLEGYLEKNRGGKE